MAYEIKGDLVVARDIGINRSIDWVGGNVIYVPISGDLNTYITSATAGDTLILANGTYTVTSNVLVNKALNIRGQGRNTTISSATDSLSILIVSVSNVKISDLNIIHTGANSTDGILINAGLSNISIKNLNITLTGLGEKCGIRNLGSSIAATENIEVTVTSYNANPAYGYYLYNVSPASLDSVVNILDSRFYAQSGSSNSKGIYAYNNNTLAQLILNIWNTYAIAYNAGADDVGLEAYSYSTNAVTINAYYSVFSGADADVRVTNPNTINLYNCTLVNSLESKVTAGMINYRGKASATHTGPLSYTDWNTFNNKANKDLSNLDSTWVNADIVPGADNTVDLGSSAKRWAEIHAYSIQNLNTGAGSKDMSINSGIGDIILNTTSSNTDAGVQVANGKTLKFTNGGHYVGFKAPNLTGGVDTIFSLPTTDGTANQVLKTDGSKNLGWVDQPTVITTLDGLSDVVITTPTTDQILKYNGAEWVNGAPGAVSAGNGIEFFLDDTTLLPTGTENTHQVNSLTRTPIVGTEVVDTITTTNAAVVMGESYLYNTALNRTIIDAGVWTFDLYASVDNATGTTELLVNTMRVRPETVTITIGSGANATATASGGIPFATSAIDVSAVVSNASYIQTPKGLYQITARASDTQVTVATPAGYTGETTVAFSTWKKLFQVTTGDDNPITPAYTLFAVNSVQPSFTTLATDKLGSIAFGQTTSATARTISFTHNGSTHYSHFSTPLVTLHNDLSTVQGLVGNEAYHLSADQHTIATQAASTTLNGYLSSTDWNTFNGKQDALPDQATHGGLFLQTDGSNLSWADSTGGDTYTNATATYTTLGGIAAGTTFSNKSMTQMWDALLYPELYPTLTNPSNSFTLTEAGLREVGEVITTLHFNAGFNRGSISPAYGTSGYRSGLPNTYTYTGTTLPGTVSSSALTDSQTISSYTVLVGAQTWSNTVTYDIGEQPLSNKGNNYNSPYPAGTTSPAINATITGVYPWYATTSAIATLTAQSLALMNSAYVQMTMVAEDGVDKQKADFPTAWSTITGIQFYNTISSVWEWIGGSKANSLATFTVTSTTHSIQGSTINYNRYTHNGSTIGSRQLRFYTT